MTKKQKQGLIILLTPFVLLVGTAILQMIMQFVFAGSAGGDGIRVAINILSFLAGIVAVLGMLPCLIIGIVFLATGGAKSEPHSAADAPQSHGPLPSKA